MREGIVLRPFAGGTGPHEFARSFVESVEAVSGGTVCAPVGSDAAGDEEVLIDAWGGGSRVGEREAAELFHQRVAPQEFSVVGVAGQDAVRVLDVYVSGFSVHGGGRGGVPQVNGVAQEVI